MAGSAAAGAGWSAADDGGAGWVSEACALGKWLYGRRGIAEIGEVEVAHKRFHEMVREVVALHQRGDAAGAEQALREVGPASRRVIALLTTVERRVREAKVANIVVLEADGRQFGLVVDEINDTEEIVVKPLGKHLKNISVYAGRHHHGRRAGSADSGCGRVGAAGEHPRRGTRAGGGGRGTCGGGGGMRKQSLVLFTGRAERGWLCRCKFWRGWRTFPGRRSSARATSG